MFVFPTESSAVMGTLPHAEVTTIASFRLLNEKRYDRSHTENQKAKVFGPMGWERFGHDGEAERRFPSTPEFGAIKQKNTSTLPPGM